MINLSKEKSVPKLKFTRPIISLPVYCIGETQKCYVLQKQPERGKKSAEREDSISFIASHSLALDILFLILLGHIFLHFITQLIVM